MSEYQYFGTTTTYTPQYGSTYSNLPGAAGFNTPQSTAFTAANTPYNPSGGNFTTQDTTYTTYNPNAVVSNYSSGTTYNSYALNSSNSNNSNSYIPQMDWASAATAAAISSAAAANKSTSSTGTWSKPTWNKQNKWSNKKSIDKTPAKTYYCDLCKISCMGSQTYQEHCNGAKHKKKEQDSKEPPKKPRAWGGFGKLYRCELCDVNCTGEQAFTAHMTGGKHNKTVMLFKKLGKAIPSPTMTNNKGEKQDVNLEQIKEDLAKKAERQAKEEAESLERKNKRQKLAEERAKKRMEDLEGRRKQMAERKAKWEEERWKREEEWRQMQERSEKEWRQWQESEQCEIAPEKVQKAAGFSARRIPNNDNHLIMKVHDAIYPEPSELTAIKNIVKVTEDTLKQISDTMRDETESELKEKGLLKEPAEGDEPMETRVLKGCVRIGDLAHGLLLRGDRVVEMLVFCTDKPTLYMLQNVKSKFDESLTEAQKKALKVEIEQGQGSFTVTDKKGFKVKITMTSKSMEEEVTAATITADVAAKVLDRKNCIRVLDELKHSKWFQMYISPFPSAVIALRVLRHLTRLDRLPEWKIVTPRLLHVLVGNVLQNLSGRRYSPGDIIRRVLECISSGVLYGFLGPIHDPSADEGANIPNIISTLSLAEVETVTMQAQEGLRQLAFDKLHEFLGVDPWVEPERGDEMIEEHVPGYQEDDFFEGYESPVPYPYPTPGVRPPARPAPYYRPFAGPGHFPVHRGPFGRMGPRMGPAGMRMYGPPIRHRVPLISRKRKQPSETSDQEVREEDGVGQEEEVMEEEEEDEMREDEDEGVDGDINEEGQDTEVMDEA